MERNIVTQGKDIQEGKKRDKSVKEEIIKSSRDKCDLK